MVEDKDFRLRLRAVIREHAATYRLKRTCQVAALRVNTGNVVPFPSKLERLRVERSPAKGRDRLT